jgi:hypothetical protein
MGENEKMNGSVYRLPEREEFSQVLREQGAEAYVRLLAQRFGPMLAASPDLTLFRQLRQMYAGAGQMDLDQLFVQEMSRHLPLPLQQELEQELPESYRDDVETARPGSSSQARVDAPWNRLMPNSFLWVALAGTLALVLALLALIRV